MIWERVPAHAILKNRGRVRVLRYRAKVEYPVILPMAGVQKLLCVFAFISVKAFHTGRGVTHNNYPIRDVYEILDVNPGTVPSPLSFWGCCELVQGSPSSRSSFSSLNLALSPDTSRRTKSVMVRSELVMSLTLAPQAPRRSHSHSGESDKISVQIIDERRERFALIFYVTSYAVEIQVVEQMVLPLTGGQTAIQTTTISPGGWSFVSFFTSEDDSCWSK